MATSYLTIASEREPSHLCIYHYCEESGIITVADDLTEEIIYGVTAEISSAHSIYDCYVSSKATGNPRIIVTSFSTYTQLALFEEQVRGELTPLTHVSSSAMDQNSSVSASNNTNMIIF
jgi:hypothetical protein